MAKQMSLYRRVQGTEGVVVDVENWEGKTDVTGSDLYMMTVASANVLTKGSLEKHVTHLSAYYGMKVLRAHLDVIQDPENGSKGDLEIK